MLVAMLMVVLLLITILQEIRVRRFKAEAEEWQARLAQTTTRTAQADALLSGQEEDVASLRATNQVLHREVLRLRGQISAASQAQPAPTGSDNPSPAMAAAGGEETNSPMQGFSSLMKGAMEQQLMGQFDRMKARLNLTPEQQSAISNILKKQAEVASGAAQRMFSGKMSQEEMTSLQKSAANPEEQIKALLDPDQLSKYQELKREESVSNARLAANSEVLQMQNVLGLSQEQQDQAYEALYQQTLEMMSGNLAKSLPQGMDPSAMLQLQMDQKTKSMEGILTPEQLQKYRQLQEKQMELIKNLMPKKTSPAAPPPGGQ